MLSTQYYVPNRNHMCRYKSSEKSWKTVELLAYCQANYQKRFFKKLPITTEITSTPMTWKRPNLTWRIASISIQQESLRRPSIPDWQCKYSPEQTCVIPREWYVSYFVLKTSKIWEGSEKFYSYWIQIIYTGSEAVPNVHTKGIICSCRIRIIRTTLIVCDSHWVKKAFVPGLNLFIPGPKY